jgi:hypothetical protein
MRRPWRLPAPAFHVGLAALVLASVLASPPAASGAPARPLVRVEPIPGAPLTRPTAVLVDGQGRIWVTGSPAVASSSWAWMAPCWR